MLIIHQPHEKSLRGLRGEDINSSRTTCGSSSPQEVRKDSWGKGPNFRNGREGVKASLRGAQRGGGQCCLVEWPRPNRGRKKEK